LAWLPQASIEHQRRVPGREVSMNKIMQSGPAQDRTCAMSGPLSRSMASHADFPPADRRRA